LAEAGLLVLAPDQRGYDGSDKPGGVASYALDVLAADVLGLIDEAGWESASLVGHDWGGIVAWWAAMHHPDRIDRLAILNSPHPIAMRRFMWSHPTQLLRSWYVFFFQVPGLPEANFRRGNWRPLCQALRRTSRPGTFTEDDLDQYRRAWSEPGAIGAMIHWYRALIRHPPRPPRDPRVHISTLLIWGPEDRFLAREVAEASLAFCDQGRLEWIKGATHWVQREEPERVNRLLIDFLRGQRHCS
jgi:pimeloyl-ACP methyl ester carboxylesterase